MKLQRVKPEILSEFCLILRTAMNNLRVLYKFVQEVTVFR